MLTFARDGVQHLPLHASATAVTPGHRRVLQVDCAAADLPGRLRWLGV